MSAETFSAPGQHSSPGRPSPIRPLLLRLFSAASIAAALLLIILVRPPAPTDHSGTPLIAWQVASADTTEPPEPDWFNSTHPSIHVQSAGVPFLEIEQKFLTAVVGGIPPDVFLYFGSVAQWSTRGALMPLDEFIARDHFNRDKFFPALWDEMSWDHRTYAIPVGTANEAFYWNKKHFREAGLDPDRPPATWDELTSYALRLTTRTPDGKILRAGYIPGYWAPGAPPLFLNWALQKRAQFLSPDGRHVTIATPAATEALDWEARLFATLGRDELIAKRASFGYGGQHGFMSGQLSMIVQKSSFVAEISKFAPKLDYGVAPLPIPVGGERAITAGAAWVGIPAGARHPEAAWEYIKFLAAADTQERSARFAAEHNVAAFFPANRRAAESAFMQSQPHMNVFVESMSFAHSATVVPLAHTVFWRAYQEAWDVAIRGTASPHDALARAEQQVQSELDSQLAYAEFYSRKLGEKSRAK